jgi:sugar lactone lactonase YvrE
VVQCARARWRGGAPLATLTPQVVLDGLVFPEGPRWHDGRLWFSDMHAHQVLAMTPAGETELIAEVPNRPSGLGFLPDGRLLIASMGDRKLLRLELHTVHSLHTLIDLTDFTGGDINDIVVDAKGRTYVGNFGYDYSHEGKFATANIVLVELDGSARVVAEDLMFPNGPVITPDGKTLIVAETFARRLTAFDIAADGGLSNRRVWADLGEATPDGICLDAESAVWVGSPTTQEFIRVREGGEVTDRIPTPGKWAVACMLGGSERTTLYLCTAETAAPELAQGKSKGWIESVEVGVAGAGLP